MDQELIELMGRVKAQSPAAGTSQLRFKDEATDDLEIEREGQKHTYTLKPMQQLFGQGLGVNSIDSLDERFHPLLMTIEREIVFYDNLNRGLTDGQVSLTLRALAMNPEAEIPGDGLARRINRGLRLFLCINDCSRQEVKLAIRKVLQSVDRHNKMSGVRGYLSFIREHLPKY
jgi:hypothetical protein